MTRTSHTSAVRVTREEARRAYILAGEPVPSNLRDVWSWPQAAAFILVIAVASWLCVGVATDAMVGVLS